MKGPSLFGPFLRGKGLEIFFLFKISLEPENTFKWVFCFSVFKINITDDDFLMDSLFRHGGRRMCFSCPHVSVNCWVGAVYFRLAERRMKSGLWESVCTPLNGGSFGSKSQVLREKGNMAYCILGRSGILHVRELSEIDLEALFIKTKADIFFRLEVNFSNFRGSMSLLRLITKKVSY